MLKPLFPGAPPVPSNRRHALAAVGGTFDVFHLGHRGLLSRAFDVGEHVLIGVTSDALAARLEKSHPVQPVSTRVNAVRRFLRQKGWTPRATISVLQDSFGPAAIREDLTAIVVTNDSLASARRLNELRRERGLAPLRIYRARLLKAESGGPISSTLVRKGQIDRFGRALSK